MFRLLQSSMSCLKTDLERWCEWASACVDFRKEAAESWSCLFNVTYHLPSLAFLSRHPQKHLCMRVSTPTHAGSCTRADFCNQLHARLLACTCTVLLFCIANCIKGYYVPTGRDGTMWVSRGDWNLWILSVETVKPEKKLNEVWPPKHLILTEGKCWQQGDIYTIKFTSGISVLLRTLVRPSFWGTCAKQHCSHVVGCCSCGEEDGHCRWGRFLLSDGQFSFPGGWSEVLSHLAQHWCT